MTIPRRPLTLTEVTDELLAGCGLRRGGATTRSYRCVAEHTLQLAIDRLVLPTGRKLNRETLIQILSGFRNRDALPSVPVFHDVEANTVTVLDGMHRVAASRAFGFADIPCTPVSAEDAELLYGFRPPRFDGRPKA